jgi:ABC-2 type transport system ATP-binding protein
MEHRHDVSLVIEVPRHPGAASDSYDQSSPAHQNYGSFTAVDAIDLEVPKGELFGFSAQRSGKDHLPSHDRRDPSSHLRRDHRRGSRHAAGPIGAKQRWVHPGPPFIYEKLTGSEFPAVRRRSVRTGRTRGRSTGHASSSRCSISRIGATSSVESLQPRHAPEADHLERVRAPAEVIVVDEPMVGSIPRRRRSSRTLFREYTRRGNTIMMSTHTLEVAEAMCDRVAIIAHGPIAPCGTMAELRGAPKRERKGSSRSSASHGVRNAARELVEVLNA